MTRIKSTGPIKKISLIIAVIIIMILVVTFGSTIGSHKTADSGDKTQQTEQLGEENEELPAATEATEQAAFSAVPYFDEDTNGMLQYADGWLYYRDEWEGEAWLMRISCEGGEPEKLYCYYVRPGKGLTESETVEKNRENTGELRIKRDASKISDFHKNQLILEAIPEKATFYYGLQLRITPR